MAKEMAMLWLCAALLITLARAVSAASILDDWRGYEVSHPDDHQVPYLLDYYDEKTEDDTNELDSTIAFMVESTTKVQEPSTTPKNTASELATSVAATDIATMLPSKQPLLDTTTACDGNYTSGCGCDHGFCYKFKTIPGVAYEPWCWTQLLGVAEPQAKFASCTSHSQCSVQMTCGDGITYRGGAVHIPTTTPTPGVKTEISWIGNMGAACDWTGRDIRSVSSPDAENCKRQCAATPRCTHFVWTPAHEDDHGDGEMCFMKSGVVSQSDAIANPIRNLAARAKSVCGLLTSITPPLDQPSCDGNYTSGCGCDHGFCYKFKTIPGVAYEPWCWTQLLGVAEPQAKFASCTNHGQCSVQMTCGDRVEHRGGVSNGPTTQGTTQQPNNGKTIITSTASTASNIGVKWNGNWAFDCDFSSVNDISRAIVVRGEECSTLCASTPGCTHFTWNPAIYGGSYCFMKTGPVSKADAFRNYGDPNVRCGIPDAAQGATPKLTAVEANTTSPATTTSNIGIKWNGNWAFDCDFSSVNDISRAFVVRGEECSTLCASTPGCTHFTWNPAIYGGSYCFMKTGPVSKADAFRNYGDPNVRCGIPDTVQVPATVKKAIIWTGDRGLGCDWPNNALMNVRSSSADLCNIQCAGTPECTHFTWTLAHDGSGDTCFMMSGAVGKLDAVASTIRDPYVRARAVCGLLTIPTAEQIEIKWSFNMALGCDWHGNDILNVPSSSAEQCDSQCSSTPNCTHFTWTLAHDGYGDKCFMKSGPVWKSRAVASTIRDPYVRVRAVCGLLKKFVIQSALPR
ncbi:hypothetical protein BV898_10780 [Hypsibius exemplaris]|uniref:Apple domain-containing protein n=1 Tax=Hypsibius exemplaris TaxID=2072580 RepID=A0A1W0WII5_HYPEX|nr:hypothetical protein BV898_10780 [Hypsibius exemplaris]